MFNYWGNSNTYIEQLEETMDAHMQAMWWAYQRHDISLKEKTETVNYIIWLFHQECAVNE